MYIGVIRHLTIDIGGAPMIVVSKVMWPPSCYTWRLNDYPRWPLDSLMYVLLHCAVDQVLVAPDRIFRESDHLKFYHQRQKQKIYEQQVRPVLELAFLPYDSKALAEPWDIDPNGRLPFIWSSLADFFTNLVLCSELKIPFVFDINFLTNNLMRIRDDLVKDGLLKDPRILNDLLAILWLYKEQDSWTLVPSGSDKGSLLDIWKQLRESARYRELSREMYRLGFARAESFEMQVSKLRDLSQGIANSRMFSGIVSVAKITVEVFLGPLGRLGSEVATQMASFVFDKQYIPPIYNLKAIEEAFDRLWYPEKPID